MKIHRLIIDIALVALPLVYFPGTVAAEPSVAETTFLGPFTGHGAALHPENQSPATIRYYGTDLGFSYSHDGKIHFLFGDTFATDAFIGIDEHYDDIFGTIDLDDWPDPGLISVANIPLIKLGQQPDSPDMVAIDPGHVMDGLKTPEAGFSNGDDELAILILSKPQACKINADCDNGLTCDTRLGYAGAKYNVEAGLTRACWDDAPGCMVDPMFDNKGEPVTGSGLCVDETSSIWADTPAARISAIGQKQRVAVRSKTEPGKYTGIKDWMTTKFINTAARTVNGFNPDNGPGYANQDYRPAGGSGTNRRVFLWGRPGFIGVSATGRSMDLYFAYVDMPVAPDFNWQLRYYTGNDKNGNPLFSSKESDAKALDLDPSRPGIQDTEIHDIVQHMSVVWIEHLKKWVMFYGGGMTKTTLGIPGLTDCGLLEFFVGPECKDVQMGNGAVRMRTADNPWGPWSTPQDVIEGAEPAVPGARQFGPGGPLYHPECRVDSCAPKSPFPVFDKNEYGFFYGANIIEEWIRPAGKSVDVIWNASTWNPYRVVLLRTRIQP